MKGTLPAALLAAPLADRFGRRPMLQLSSIIFFLAPFLMIFSQSEGLFRFIPAYLYANRFFVGVAVGCSLGIIPTYVSELSVVAPTRRGTIDPNHSGLLVTLNNLFWVSGQVLSSLTNAAFSYQSGSWPYPPIFITVIAGVWNLVSEFLGHYRCSLSSQNRPVGFPRREKKPKPPK